ncbi:MAG: DMT family transporter [Promethearchaeia archaeon]
MSSQTFKKGIGFGIAGIILIGLQPIVANSRPEVLDSYLFAAMTVLIEALMFLPLFLFERYRFKKKIKKQNSIIDNSQLTRNYERLLNGWKSKKNIILIIYVGLTFAIAQILFFVGYREAGAINGSLAQKTTVIFGLLFGYLINKEHVNYVQIIFSFILLVGLTVAITEGSFNVLDFNVGVLMLLFVAIMWMLAHALTKPIFEKDEATQTFMVFSRNAVGGIFLLSTYFLLYPLENVALLFEPLHIFYFIIMGLNYGFGLFCWYKVLAYLGTSKGTAMVSGTPIITVIFSSILLGEKFTIFHLIGMLLVICSVIIIVIQKDRKQMLV